MKTIAIAVKNTAADVAKLMPKTAKREAAKARKAARPDEPFKVGKLDRVKLLADATGPTQEEEPQVHPAVEDESQAPPTRAVAGGGLRRHFAGKPAAVVESGAAAGAEPLTASVPEIVKSVAARQAVAHVVKKARVARTCGGCQKKIAVGEQVTWWGNAEGTFSYRCSDCPPSPADLALPARKAAPRKSEQQGLRSLVQAVEQARVDLMAKHSISKKADLSKAVAALSHSARQRAGWANVGTIEFSEMATLYLANLILAASAE